MQCASKLGGRSQACRGQAKVPCCRMQTCACTCRRGWNGATCLGNLPACTLSPRLPCLQAQPWSHDTEAFRRWKEGRTGWPLVDANMVRR